MADNNLSIILISDDDSLVREAVGRLLQLFGYEVVSVSDGNEAINTLNDDFAAVILDINMPGLDGFETLKEINKMNLGIPVLLFTGAGSMEYAVKAVNLGAYDFITKPIDDIAFFEVKIKRAIEKRGFLLKERIYKENLENEVKNKTRELEEKNILLEKYSYHIEESSLNTIITLNTALEEKDWYTAGHTRRVTEYSDLIGKAMKLTEEELKALHRGCQLHDIGKLVIDVSCIQKPGPLTEEEWTQVKKHPEVGSNIIKPLSFLDKEIAIVRHHHERMDGKGYPDGLCGDELDILTRILIVADSYDAMTSTRSYKKNMTPEEAVIELNACKHTQFDPDVVDILTDSIEKRKQKFKCIGVDNVYHS
ncbi:MAG: HD domain-containing phosphohydrolase [Thermodesulfobacteriota bacterium]